ncbi:polysaccharide pyruvyl transferase family protein [Stappia indica]|uniref:polysaccharide pyruvyl transferase family protein n=1 Tax=Stappia indica TaxID=538381 RepID=UPI0008351411|nr:polysaccharide pyruvyl transferase family protein [Stappia indica]
MAYEDTVKAAAFLGTDGGICFATEGFDKALKRVGENTGNTLFQRALWDLVRIPKLSVSPGADSREFLRNNCSHLIIPAANQINPNFNMEYWTNFIEDVDLPCIVMGLGAQSDQVDATAEDFPFTESVIKFAKCLSRRTATIGVRGKYTQDVLSQIGVTNTTVIGCPSQTLNNSISGESIAKQLRNLVDGRAVSVAILGGTLQEYARDVEKSIFDLFFFDKKSLLVLQTEKRIMNFVYSGKLDANAREFMNWHRSVVVPSLGLDEYFHFMALRGRVYSDARSWVDGMRKVDLAIGMRIHGAMAAIQAGRLGICVAFDSRTHELAQTMAIPYITAQNMKNCRSIQDVVCATVFSADEFDTRRAENIKRIDEILFDLNKL